MTPPNGATTDPIDLRYATPTPAELKGWLAEHAPDAQPRGGAAIDVPAGLNVFTPLVRNWRGSTSILCTTLPGLSPEAELIVILTVPVNPTLPDLIPISTLSIV